MGYQWAAVWSQQVEVVNIQLGWQPWAQRHMERVNSL